MKTAVITDTTAYLQKETIEALQIHTVPLSVNFSDGSFREGIDLTTEEFYQKLGEEEALPTTSQPAIGEFVELFDRLEQEGYTDVVCIHLSAKISGTLQTALSAGEMKENLTVYGFDSKISCSPQGFYVRSAAKLALEGSSGSDIIQYLTTQQEQVRAYFMVHDLNHLRRGGRLSGAQAVFGSLLQIKPILHFEDGQIMPFEKVRTEKKALNRILDLLFADLQKGNVSEIAVIHANRPEGADMLKEKILSAYPHADIEISYFGPVIGTHLGPSSLGIGWC
ncbi:DegV family protein [Shouchella sp. JSM 1781072]|uniref:DegV family protein n=1 Tax=Bacillaceae TaxID=186817 RepID=UPI000C08B417|nr:MULTISPECIES: DegV family protein [Bacillaceae]